MLFRVRRVLVIGPGGAGKSTTAVRLAEALALPLVHLDALYWKPGWVKTADDEWRTTVERLAAEDAWVMDGNYGGTLDLRLAACDTAIFLDMPRLVCIWRVMKRAWVFRGTTRPDMREGCPERLTWEFLRWIWTYRRKRGPDILSRLDALRGEKDVVILRSTREVDEFLRCLQRSRV